MLFTLIGLLVTPVPEHHIPAVDLCEVGRIAVADLPPSKSPNNFIETDPKRSGLMKRCPQLARHLPDGYVAANDDARARAARHFPMPGPVLPWAGIYSFDAPVMAADGRSATVALGWECSGPCGSDTVSRYVRTAEGWRREGQPQVLRAY